MNETMISSKQDNRRCLKSDVISVSMERSLKCSGTRQLQQLMHQKSRKKEQNIKTRSKKENNSNSNVRFQNQELIEAVIANDQHRVHTLLSSCSSGAIDTVHPILGYNAIHAAVQHNVPSLVHALLRMGASVHTITTTTGMSPLHLAALYNAGKLVPLFLSNGADKTLLDAARRKPCMVALESGNLQVAHLCMPEPQAPEVVVTSCTSTTVELALHVEEQHLELDEMQLEWTFRIKVENGGHSSLLIVDQCHCTIPDLVPAIDYTVSVQAHTPAGWGLWSAPHRVRTKGR